MTNITILSDWKLRDPYVSLFKGDIIQHERLQKLLGKNFISILSDEQVEGHEHGFVSAELIKKSMHEGLKIFYLCGLLL